MAVGGLAVFPADTVYGIACDPENRFAVERLYLLKRRSMDKPSAVMFFDLELALSALPELGERLREALRRLLPGSVTALVPNPARRFPLACGGDPYDARPAGAVGAATGRSSAAGAAVERQSRRRPRPAPAVGDTGADPERRRPRDRRR